MQRKFLIDLSSLPEGGKRFCGELSEDLYDLPPGDAIPRGPLEYDLLVQRFESELLITGSLSSRFEFTCVRTLHPFVQTIRLEQAAISLEIGTQTEIDATDALREEVLLHFPVDPRCDEGDEPGHCEIDPRYLAVDKPGANALPPAARAGGDDRWSALDNLKDLKDQP